jgi:hypothetical protein
MFSVRAGVQLILVVAIAVFAAVGRANDLSWIQGQTCASSWSIDPAHPHDTDAIQFSGPVHFYLNRCVAERTLGGKPTLLVDHAQRTIQVKFVLPPSSDCADFWAPVCGLKGSVGPLEEGPWRLFSNAPGAVFSLEFTVGGDAAALAVYYVDPNAPGAKSGSSWKDAFNSLQDALAAVEENSEIRVAHGIYRPDGGTGIEPLDRSVTFRLKTGVILKGGYAGWRGTNPNSRDVLAYRTILSGDLAHDDKPLPRLGDMLTDPGRVENSYHVVSLSGTDASAVLDGFTITGGIDTDNELPDDLSGGGGIYNDGGSATLRNCRILGNASAYRGGGLYSCGNGTVVLVDCTVAGNWSPWAGGGIFLHGGTDLILSRCVVTGNRAEFHGGGICCDSGGQLMISNSVISGNWATDSTWSRGGGLYGSTTVAHLNHCTFVGNEAAAGTALACELFSDTDTSEMHLSNCILWGDPNLIYKEDNALVEIISSDVHGGWAGAGNVDVDPCFVQTGHWSDAGTAYDPCDDTWSDGDYHLRGSSPCVDAGNLQAVWDPNGTDLGGQPRVSGITVDLGAYELRNDPPVAEAGPDVTGFTLDINTKGTVTLDASKSHDPEGQPLHYQWYCDNKLVSDLVRFTTNLPVGTHTFKLVVSDPTGLTGSDQATATVTLVVNTKTFISPQKLPRNGNQDVLTLTVLPKGKLPKDFDASEPLRLFPGGIAAVKQSAFVWLSGDTLVLGTFKHADVMAAVPANGRIELRVVGRLKDGQHFSAVDKVTIQ